MTQKNGRKYLKHILGNKLNAKSLNGALQNAEMKSSLSVTKICLLSHS